MFACTNVRVAAKRDEREQMRGEREATEEGARVELEASLEHGAAVQKDEAKSALG